MKSSHKGSLATGLKGVSDQKVLQVMRQTNKLRNPRRLRRAITATGKPRAPEWTQQEEALLGKIPDADVAKRLGRTFVGVQLRRGRLGIPNYGRPAMSFKPWSPEELELLGTMPDRLIARKLRRTVISVTDRRYKLGIPAKIEGYHRWRPEDEALLGQRPDKYIAKLLGTTVTAVRDRRHALKIHIRPPTLRFFQEWTPEEDALLGTAPDAEIARRLNCASVVSTKSF